MTAIIIILWAVTLAIQAALLYQRRITIKVRNEHGFIELRRVRAKDLPVLNDNLQLAEQNVPALERERDEARERLDLAMRQLGQARAEISRLKAPPVDRKQYGE